MIHATLSKLRSEVLEEVGGRRLLEDHPVLGLARSQGEIVVHKRDVGRAVSDRRRHRLRVHVRVATAHVVGELVVLALSVVIAALSLSVDCGLIFCDRETGTV